MSDSTESEVPEKDGAIPIEDDGVSLEEKESFRRRLHVIEEHVEGVRRAGRKLANRLIDEGKFELARRLSQRVHCHDMSKWQGIEWDILTLPVGEVDKDELKIAVENHQQGNDHHPEYQSDGIKAMSDEQLAEMVCDWYSRSSEKGTDLRAWVKEKAMDRYDFSPQTKVYKKLKYFLDLLLDKPFS